MIYASIMSLVEVRCLCICKLEEWWVALWSRLHHVSNRSKVPSHLAPRGMVGRLVIYASIVFPIGVRCHCIWHLEGWLVTLWSMHPSCPPIGERCLLIYILRTRGVVESCVSSMHPSSPCGLWMFIVYTYLEGWSLAMWSIHPSIIITLWSINV